MPAGALRTARFRLLLVGAARGPHYDSDVWQSAGVREGGESIVVDETTTIRWFSVDASGTTERQYTPGRGNNSRRETIRIN